MHTYQPDERFNRAENHLTALPETLGLLAVVAAAVMFLLFVALSVATHWQTGTPITTAMEIVSTTGEVDLSELATTAASDSLKRQEFDTEVTYP